MTIIPREEALLPFFGGNLAIFGNRPVTRSSTIADAGIPAAVIHPGSIAQAHTTDADYARSIATRERSVLPLRI